MEDRRSCLVDAFSRRVCERGVKGCVVYHYVEEPPEQDADGGTTVITMALIVCLLGIGFALGMIL